MLFTSPFFIFFFLPVFLSAYYLAPNHTSSKNTVALLGSILFFAWGEPIFVFILVLTTYIDYHISKFIEPHSSVKQHIKLILLSIAIVLNTCILIGSKYLNFIYAQCFGPLHTYFNLTMTQPNFPLILGISFITFHKISYLVDSYKGRATPPRHFFDCALYIFLFPQLIAGPIIRYHDIGMQLQNRKHTADGFIVGFTRFSIGLLKKLFIADPLGLIADQVFSLPTHELSFLFAWGGILAYTLQIYFDFSGYSDMAIGLGRMIGFRFPENFNRPYTARSITDFWRRWHISLSNWMRLYLYIPLGGNRVSIPKTYLNLWVVFLISGFWHGASWNFVIWGGYYGFFLCLERVFNTSRWGKKLYLPHIMKQIITLFIIMIGWVFFRAATLHEALHYISILCGFAHADHPVLPWGSIFTNQAITTMMLGSLLAFVTIPLPKIMNNIQIQAAWTENMEISGIKALNYQFILTLSLLSLSAAAIVSSDYVPFLYFRF